MANQKNEKLKRQQNKQMEFTVSKEGKAFVVGSHVSFTLHKKRYQGVVKKQLSNSAIIEFDEKFCHQPLVAELKNKVVISYHAMKLVK